MPALLQLNHARVDHLTVELVPFACSLSDAGEHTVTAVSHRHIVDQLHNQHRLAHACSAKQSNLATSHVRRNQVNHFDAHSQHILRRHTIVESRRSAVNWPFLIDINLATLIIGISQHVHHATESGLSNRNRDRAFQPRHFHAGEQIEGVLHGDATHEALALPARHLHHNAGVGAAHLERIPHRALHVALQLEVDDDTIDGDHSRVRLSVRVGLLVEARVRVEDGARVLHVLDSRQQIFGPLVLGLRLQQIFGRRRKTVQLIDRKRNVRQVVHLLYGVHLILGQMIETQILRMIVWKLHIARRYV
mmetsp:Transcript_309/g.501  ORF Transcript_309/g.501 Transcript_309/m.501 type:complete len:305 (+) Transcript_309:1173-2087(+)